MGSCTGKATGTAVGSGTAVRTGTAVGSGTGAGAGTRRCSRTRAGAGAGPTTGATGTAPGWLQNTVRVPTRPFRITYGT
nr:hypothetical protein [Streptomyces sp. FL06-04B]